MPGEGMPTLFLCNRACKKASLQIQTARSEVHFKEMILVFGFGMDWCRETPRLGDHINRYSRTHSERQRGSGKERNSGITKSWFLTIKGVEMVSPSTHFVSSPSLPPVPAASPSPVWGWWEDSLENIDSPPGSQSPSQWYCWIQTPAELGLDGDHFSTLLP